VLLQNCKAV